MKKTILFLLLIVHVAEAFSQVDSIKHKTKKGFSMGGVPVVAYNTDKGFMYGLAISLYNYGDGTYYPNYKQNLYLEWSRTTKKNQLNQALLEMKDLFHTKVRMLSEFSYMTDKLLPFYGFNGYGSFYNSNYETQDETGYLSRAYYRIDRSNLRITTDFQAPLKNEHFRWVAGAGFLNFKIKTVDVDFINSTLPDKDTLPHIPTLYDEYVTNGIIKNDEKNGGKVFYLKAGIVYDTRNQEANPSKGLWIEFLLSHAPTFVNAKSYLDATFIARHYFKVFVPRLTMANRIGYQGKLWGTKPFYAFPYLISSHYLVEAFGGIKTIRGVMANRLVGDGVVFGNFEIRYKFLVTRFLKQDFYISANTFLDWGMVVQKYKVDKSKIALLRNPIDYNDNLHYSTGAGLRFAFNQNFIIAADYGKALKRADGQDALYIAFDFLY